MSKYGSRITKGIHECLAETTTTDFQSKRRASFAALHYDRNVNLFPTLFYVCISTHLADTTFKEIQALYVYIDYILFFFAARSEYGRFTRVFDAVSARVYA